MTVISIPTPVNQAKKSAIQVLKDVLALAEKGEIDNVLIITSNTDSSWSHVYSECLNICEVLGRLEVLKAEWIDAYREEFE